MGNKGLLDRVWQDEDMVIEHSFVAKAIEQSQVKMEGYNFDLRKHLLEYDDVINKQREVIYGQRRKILSTNNLKPLVLDMVHDELQSLVETYIAGNYRDEWDFAGLANAVRMILPLPNEAIKQWETIKPDEIEEYLVKIADEEYEKKEMAIGVENMQLLGRLVMLNAVDKLWVRHLTTLDELRTGIGLRAFGQQDPLVTFKREAFGMFENLNRMITHDIVHTVYHAQLQVNRPQAPRPMREVRAKDEQSRKAMPSRSGPKVGRNDPCPCGSGKKFKNCHLGKESELLAMAPTAKARR
jgi:preprotein translocase subunit SecA